MKIKEVTMKKSTLIIGCLALWLGLFPPALTGSELGNENLKGIRYVMVAVELNGVAFKEGYTDREEEKTKELNLDEAAEKMEEDAIPITPKDIRTIYVQTNKKLRDGGLQTLKAKSYTDTKSTVIPTLTVRLDTLTVGKDMYAGVLHVTLTKMMSNWSGGKRIHAPVFIWSEKELLAAGKEDLLKTIESMTGELLEVFLVELAEANMIEEPEEETEGEENAGTNNG